MRDDSAAAALPFRFRLAPDVDPQMLVRGGEPAWAAVDRSQTPGDGDRSDILRIDAVNDVVPAERVERPVHRRCRALRGIALSPRIADQSPAHFRPGPVFRLPWPE